MSGCSGSNRPSGSGWRLAILLGALALLGVAGVAVAAGGKADSGRTRSKRVEISDRGITIEESRGRDRQRVRVHGPAHVRFDSLVVDEDSHGEDVDLPGIHIERGECSIVRMFSDVTVDSTERVEDTVVALFGNIDVRGRVSGDAVAVLGSVRLAPGAVVEGDAVAVGGAVEQAPGSSVGGERVSLTFFPILPGVSPVRAICLFMFGLWAIAILLGGLLAMLVPHRIHRIAETISERTGRSLLLGFFMPLLIAMSALLMMVTVVGIPVAVLLPALYLLILWIGLVASSYLLGCRFMGRGVGEGGLFPPLLTGSLVVAVLFGISVVLAGPPGRLSLLGMAFAVLATLFAKVLAIVGSGAAVLSGFGAPPKPSLASEAAPPAPPDVSPTPSPVSPA